MSHRLPDQWVWDFWLVDDGPRRHLFHLSAARELAPADRHRHARVRHAVSEDLTQWEPLGEVVAPSPGPAFDDLAIWTGSIVRGDDQQWHLFYTGLSRQHAEAQQQIGHAVSSDLHVWARVSTEPVVCPDPRWYRVFGDNADDQPWRDPFVVRDPGRDGWHMLVTASAAGVADDDSGVIGHAWSADLVDWEGREAVASPRSGFNQLEVPQVIQIEGQWVLVANCLGPDLSAQRRARGIPGGAWWVAAPSPIGPFDLAKATRLTDESLYAAKVTQAPDGAWVVLAFALVTTRK